MDKAKSDVASEEAERRPDRGRARRRDGPDGGGLAGRRDRRRELQRRPWELDEARKAEPAGPGRPAKAAADVESQRGGIVQLVTESYQNGTELNTATALMSDEGPQGLMNRYGVVQSAGDSMEARYDRFRASPPRRPRPTPPRRPRPRSTRQTSPPRPSSSPSPPARPRAPPARRPTRSPSQKQQLVQALAKAAEHLGRARHQAARRRWSGSPSRRPAAGAQGQGGARLQAAPAEGSGRRPGRRPPQARARPTDPSRSDRATATAVLDRRPGRAPPPVANPAPNQSVAVQRAIAYAKAQLGEPYQWAAAGRAPSTARA